MFCPGVNVQADADNPPLRPAFARLLASGPSLIRTIGALPLPREPSTGHHQGSSPLRLIVEKVPFFAFSAASSVVTVFAQRRAGAVGSLEAFPMETRLANSMVSYARYIGKMIWPHDLAVLYPYPETIPLWQVVMAGLCLWLYRYS